MNEIPDFIKQMDWNLLSRQKESLVLLSNYVDSVSLLYSHLEGVIHLLDVMADYAVDTLQLDERTVFPTLQIEP